MANRRMFSKTVVASSRFLRMPATSRLLYYDLGMSADDDGYCEWYPVMQMTGAKEQDFDVLRSNELIFIFDSEVLVIRDWKENNFIRSDRYTPSKYLGKYENMLGLPFGIPTDNQMDTQVRLGKVSNTSVAAAPQIEVVSDSEESTRAVKPPKFPNARTAISWFPRPQPSWSINTTELKHAELLYSRGEDKVKEMLEFVKEYRDDDYFPSVTKPSDLERKWLDLVKKRKKMGV